MKRILTLLLALALAVAAASACAEGALTVEQENLHIVGTTSLYCYMYVKVKNTGDAPIFVNKGSFTLRDKEGNEIMLSDILGTDENEVPDAVALRIESSRAIAVLRQVLDTRERTVVLLRYGLTDGRPRSQHEIAEVLGISRSYVSRIEKKALEKMKYRLNGEEA